MYDLGVRDMELVNKFDNAFAGVAGDGGSTGLVVNSGNRYETGKFWQMQHCAGDGHNHDKTQPTLPSGPDRDQLAGNLLAALLPAGATPAYPPAPHCNARGLTALGEHLVRRMIDRKMVIDPDHLGIHARNQLLSIVEAERYSGVVSSHSWSTPDATPRILRLGGLVTPMAGSATEFAEAWRETKPHHDPRFYWGIGWGADMNGFAHQGTPRGGVGGAGPVTYPFKSFDGKVTLDRQRSGQRVYDVNVDGMAHYGLFPDWVEDVRKVAGDEIVGDLGRGAEAYLQMWERAEGIPATRCRPFVGHVTSRGIGGVRLGRGADELLRRVGQPGRRPGRAWTWCLPQRGSRPAGETTAVLTPAGTVAFAATTGAGQRALGRRPGLRVTRRLRARTKPYGRGVRVRRVRGGSRIVIGVRRGRVRYVGVATRDAARTRAALRAQLRIAGLR